MDGHSPREPHQLSPMHRTLAGTLAVLLLTGAGWACATTGTSGGNSLSMSATAYSGGELTEAPHDNLYDFLRDHNRVRVGQLGAGSPLGVRYQGQYVEARLYIDDSDVANPVTRLRQLRPEQVASLRILDPSDASSRYGGRGRFAVISVTLQ